MKFKTDQNDVVITTGSAITDYDYTENDLVEGVDPDSIEPGKYKWNNGDPIKIDLPPEPNKAFEQINQYFITVEGLTEAGLNRVDSLMSKYPSTDRAIANKNYGIAKNRIQKANSDGMLSNQEASDLIDIVDGKA